MAAWRHWFWLAALAVFVTAMSPALAHDLPHGSRVPMPHPPHAEGGQCVAPTDVMRRDHMTMLFHQRDGTMHEGIRTKRFSLNACLECHAVKGDDGKAVSYADERHFCRSCHSYAAVNIDCFSCHASRPGEPDKTASQPGDAIHAALKDFVQGQNR